MMMPREGRRFEGMRNGRRREEEGEGVKAKTERVGEIRDLRTDRRTLLCSHRGVQGEEEVLC